MSKNWEGSLRSDRQAVFRLLSKVSDSCLGLSRVSQEGWGSGLRILPNVNSTGGPCTEQDLDQDELSWPLLFVFIFPSLLECHLVLLIAVIFLSGLWIELSSLPPHSLSSTTFEHQWWWIANHHWHWWCGIYLILILDPVPWSRTIKRVHPLCWRGAFISSILTFLKTELRQKRLSGNIAPLWEIIAIDKKMFPLPMVSPKLSWQVLTGVFATSRKLRCHSLNKENSDVAWN